jgi:hypothetical protein
MAEDDRRIEMLGRPMSKAAVRKAGNSSTEYPLDVGGLNDKLRADQIMAEFASAFSLEMDFERRTEPLNNRKWPAGWTIAFSLAVSAALWGLLTAVFYFI